MALFDTTNLHQSDEQFSVKSRRKQCALTRLLAILTDQNIPLISWSRTTVDKVF